jgi:DNA-binding NarL/FixJ family response regulator
MTKSCAKLAILEDHSLFRKILVDFLSSSANFKVVIQSATVLDLLYKLKSHEADILIMDPFLPSLEGEFLPHALGKEFPDLKIIVLSMCTDPNIISDLLGSGIYGYVSKGDDPDELISAISAVSQNKIFRNKFLTEALYLSQLKDLKNYTGSPINLNEREIKILNLLWEEKTNREIAQDLCLSVRSVEKIRQDIREKLNVKSTVAVFKYAISKKLIGANYKSPFL